MTKFPRDGAWTERRLETQKMYIIKVPQLSTLRTNMPLLFVHRKLTCGNNSSLFQKKE